MAVVLVCGTALMAVGCIPDRDVRGPALPPPVEESAPDFGPLGPLPTPLPARPLPTLDPAAPPRTPLDAASLEHYRGLASGEQLAMLDDGVVTFDEYTLATEQYAACLEGNGARVDGLFLREGGRFYVVNYVTTNPDPEAVRLMVEPCMGQYAAISGPWEGQLRTPLELHEGVRPTFIQCLKDVDTPFLSENPSLDDLIRITHLRVFGGPLPEVTHCQHEIRAEYDLWDFQF